MATKSWFCYVGTNPSNPSSYELTTDPFLCGCGGFIHLCAIYASIAVTSNPILTASILTAISTAIKNGTPNALVSLKP